MNDKEKITPHKNFKSFVQHITNGSELYDNLKLVLENQHHFHKKIPFCEKNGWSRQNNDPNFFILKIQDIDRVYVYSNISIVDSDDNNIFKYDFIGRICNKDDSFLYIYTRGTMITNDFVQSEESLTICGFIFMSNNLNLFLRCVLTKCFIFDDEKSHLYHIFRSDNKNTTAKSFFNNPQRLLRNNDDDTLQNRCLQIVKNNIQYFKETYEIPPLMEEMIDEEIVIAAIKEYKNFRQNIQPRKRSKYKICLRDCVSKIDLFYKNACATMF